VYAGCPTTVSVDIDPDDEVNLVGAVIVWKVYNQKFGTPVEGEDPIITKDNGVGGTIVVTDPETQTLEFPIEGEDTADLASANYYCKMTVDDIPVAIGMMTILTT